MTDKIISKGSILVPERIFSIEIYKDDFIKGGKEHFIVNGVELKHLGSFAREWLRKQVFGE